ncbi:hypothetical protein FRB96_000318 [Tulasnella sp. 330]|nr:hypothetical protein FRB96_000318 [Tulasnella sp. 330]KAG8877620.1 hypothetical protein FRB97_003249 [Tulasnella sp. 331]KAG8890876.1 hypothetical protein FRB98_002894 [Tulasnella sp. 332]
MSYYQDERPNYSQDSVRPLSNPNYHAAPSNPSRYDDAPQRRKGVSPWLKYGLPLLLIVIIAAVVGGVVGSKHSSSSSSSSSSSANGGGGNSPPNASQLSSIKSLGVFPTSTNAHTIPIYPSETNQAAFTVATFVAAANSGGSTWSADPFQPANPSPTSVRTDRPRLIAPAYKWAQLETFMATDPYMQQWNATIMQNANTWEAMDPVAYVIDGGLTESGVLDPAREVKERIKAFAYAYRITNQTMWVDRAWKELQNACGQGTQPFGTPGNNWNTGHFLDVAEFTNAFAIGYDWLYDAWTDAQKTTIRDAITSLGLQYGVASYNGSSAGTAYNWWQTVNGNWNCVCNGGMTLGALAILGDDTTGLAEQMLGYTVDNAKANCANGPSSDGTWSETPNYWYFGTLAHAEMTSALQTATGSSYDLMTINPTFADTGLFHMYVYGNQQMFDYGDAGPNKYSTTANGMMLHATIFNRPEYMLFQRDRPDSGDPWSMFWYDPSVAGAWWDGLAFDHHFDDPLDNWASMRSSWTDQTGLYVAMKSGNHTGHQTHGDLDAGDFVIDALGVRWAGELGSGDYDSVGYFSSEAQDSQRWLYYRKRTEGQNTLVVNWDNQNADASTPCNFGTTNETQGSSTVYTVPSTSTAFFTTDLTNTYNGVSIQRGIRMVNGRTQVLLQDDITGATTPVQWRMHTNATVVLSNGNTTATLTLENQTMEVNILNPASGVAFETLEAVRYDTDPALPPNSVDQPNPGVTVLAITLQPGTYNLQVLFNPQWPGSSASSFKTPSFVAVESWSLTSAD